MAKRSLGGNPPILGPKDASPPADKYHDYMNYRGVAEEHMLKPLLSGEVSLGRYLEPHGKVGRELFLPGSVLKRHCAVIGRTGAGKTESIVIPWILGLLKQGYSVVTIDVLGNLESRLRSEAKKLGCRVWYWNSDRTDSDSWNWLNEINISDSRDVEAALTSILGRLNPSDNQPFFYKRDCRWLRALIKITKTIYVSRAKPRDLFRLVADQESLINQFRRCSAIGVYATEVADLLGFSNDKHSEAVSGLLNALSVFNDSSVIDVSESSDFSLSDIDTHPTLLIIGDSLGNEKASQLSSLMINQIINHVYRRSTGSVKTRVPMSLIIDEAPRLKERIDFKEVLAVARNAGVGICLAAQDVSQFGNDQQIAEVLTNCNTFIALRDAPPQTAAYLSQQLGKRREQKVSITHKRGVNDTLQDIDRGESMFWVLAKNIFGVNDKSVDIEEVPVLGEREIMYPPVGNYPAIVLSSPVSNKPFLIDLDLAGRKI